MRKIVVSGLGMLVLATNLATAQAEVVRSPARAVEILVQARIMAERCGWLDTAARNDLSTFAARAELAAVRREGAAAARKAVRNGRLAARKAVCDTEGQEMVLAVLEGAREAMRAMAAGDRRQTVARQNAPAQPISLKPEPTSARLQDTSTHADRRQEQLARYQKMAATYYHELKCRRLSHDALMRMWQKVRKEHMALLRKGAGKALAAAKKAAERQGRQRRC